jgi:hypothetical protein
MLACAAEAPGPGSMGRALGPLWDYLAAMTGGPLHGRQGPVLRYLRRVSRPGDAGVRLACGGRRTRAGAALCALSGQRGGPWYASQQGVPTPDRALHDLADLGGDLLGRVIGGAKPDASSGSIHDVRPGSRAARTARAPVQLTTGCRQQPTRPLIAGHAFDLRRKPPILNATATVSTLRFRRQEPGCRDAAYCHGGTPGAWTKFVHRHRRS